MNYGTKYQSPTSLNRDEIVVIQKEIDFQESYRLTAS